MERTRFIEHRGVRIFVVDLTDLRGLDEVRAVIEAASAQVRKEPATGSLLSLIDLRGVAFSLAGVEVLQRFARENAPYVCARAALTDEPLGGRVAAAVARMSGRPVRVFLDPESARDWLVEQG